MNFNFEGHLIESRLRTQDVDRRATRAAMLGPAPARSLFARFRRERVTNQPVALPQRQGENAAARSAKAA